MIRTPSKQWGVCNKFMNASVNHACCLEANQNKAQKNAGRLHNSRDALVDLQIKLKDEKLALFWTFEWLCK